MGKFVPAFKNYVSHVGNCIVAFKNFVSYPVLSHNVMNCVSYAATYGVVFPLMTHDMCVAETFDKHAVAASTVFWCRKARNFNTASRI